MKFRHIFIVILCFVFFGCLSKYLIPADDLNAQSHMALAQAQKDALNFSDAIKEYVVISQKYPYTNYHKTAVFKTALTHLDPGNPKMDYTAAQKSLNTYLKLPLLSEEKETALLLTALIQQVTRQKEENNKLLANIDQKEKDLSSITKRLHTAWASSEQTKEKLEKLKAIETELSILKDKLQKMKEIDVQMHQTRKN